MSELTDRQKLYEYKKNMQIFIKKVEEEITFLIKGYESQIQKLKAENYRLSAVINKSHNSLNRYNNP